MKTFKVGIVPGAMVEVTVENSNISVEKLFKMAGKPIDSTYKVRLNGEAVDISKKVSSLGEVTTFYATRQIKGN